MKRLLISIVLLAGIAAGAMAQYDWKERRNSLSVTVGSPSLISGGSGVFTSMFSKDADMSIFGTYGLNYGFNVLKWMRVGGSFFYSGWKMDKSDEEKTKTDRYDEMALLAKVDFTYLNRKYVRLYSGAGVGANLTNIRHITDGIENKDNLNPSEFMPYCGWVVTPIGVEAGGKCVYGIAEINIGRCDFFRAGLGFRF